MINGGAVVAGLRCGGQSDKKAGESDASQDSEPCMQFTFSSLMHIHMFPYDELSI